jgi:hypothetical protein
MVRRKTINRRKIIGNLKLMEKLKYGDDYIDIYYLVLVLSLVGGAFSGGVGFILLPLFFFYLAAAQLYSGIGLAIWTWEWHWTWEYKLVAKYTKERQPDLFYLNVISAIAIGIALSTMGIGIYLSTR